MNIDLLFKAIKVIGVLTLIAVCAFYGTSYDSYASNGETTRYWLEIVSIDAMCLVGFVSHLIYKDHEPETAQ